jgi:hypothetical protein
MNRSWFLRVIHFIALPRKSVGPYDRRHSKRHTMGIEVRRLQPSGCHRGPTVDQRIRRPDPRVPDVAAALLRMDPSDRQSFIRPLIALILSVAADGSGPTSAPGTPANGDLHPHPRTPTTAPDAVEELAPM